MHTHEMFVIKELVYLSLLDVTWSPNHYIILVYCYLDTHGVLECHVFFLDVLIMRLIFLDLLSVVML
jgi:hypothetical protein